MITNQGFSVFRMGFVTQDDVLFPHLTVRETLMYAALLRLPSNFTRSQKIQRAEDTIVELGLERSVRISTFSTHMFSIPVLSRTSPDTFSIVTCRYSFDWHGYNLEHIVEMFQWC